MKFEMKWREYICPIFSPAVSIDVEKSFQIQALLLLLSHSTSVNGPAEPAHSQQGPVGHDVGLCVFGLLADLCWWRPTTRQRPSWPTTRRKSRTCDSAATFLADGTFTLHPLNNAPSQSRSLWSLSRSAAGHTPLPSAPASPPPSAGARHAVRTEGVPLLLQASSWLCSSSPSVALSWGGDPRGFHWYPFCSVSIR